MTRRETGPRLRETETKGTGSGRPEPDAGTMPSLLMRAHERWRDDVGWSEKESGRWKEYRWKDGYENAKHFGLGLITLGLKPGDKVCQQGTPGCKLYWAMYGVWGMGGVHVSLPFAATATDIPYRVELCDVTFAVVRGPQNLDKWLSVREQVPGVKMVITLEAGGPWTSGDPWLTSYDQVVDMGREYEGKHPQSFEHIARGVKPDDLAGMYFTGGTTGKPKAVMHTHRGLIEGVTDLQRVFPASQEDNLAGTTGTWAEVVWGTGPQLLKGVRLRCTEDPLNRVATARDASPYVLTGTPKQWDVVASAMDPRAAGVTYLEVLCRMLLPVCYRVSELESAGKKPGPFWGALHCVARWLLTRPCLGKVGLRKTRIGIVAGGIARLSTFRFLRAMGLDLRQYYGSSESAMLSAQRKGDIQWGNVGSLMPAAEVKLAEDGELLSRHPGQFIGYYKNPEATQEVLKDGWFHTGDVATIDADGHLVFVDRKSALRELRGGRKYSPLAVETQLKAGSYIKDAVALGGNEADYLSAIVIISSETVGKWAQRRGIAYRDAVDLSQHDDVAGLITDIIRQANHKLPAPARVMRYVVFHREFEAGEAELTLRGKMMRSAVENKYTGLAKAIYQGLTSVVLQDGTRTATLKVRCVE